METSHKVMLRFNEFSLLLMKTIFLFRKFSEAQKEMQGLRTRLTLAETKLVEKEVELNTLKEENSGLKESLEKIVQQQQLGRSDSEFYLIKGHNLFSEHLNVTQLI